ncbi:hypothetical protein FJ930_29655 [Mesorhizobium sp. B2-4-15]|uniref:hypothetical protein n=1 Tax=Mesorhizobium sp. B2-4-15 TaxID=2589934 RepID=UPI001153CAA9|nr:hypothetical protein [Mesorhizobium sp. B2-4-15]TPK58607.1 hypothetical protein FJ930_29655 [Mesorhizobium sp. B2-4-15]
MSKIEELKVLVDQNCFKTFLVDNEIAVATGCLYPSNGSVTVYVSGGTDLCVVSDRGATAHTVEAHGIAVPDIARWLGPFCRQNGLRLEGNQITSPAIDVAHVPTLISLVANTASIAARYALDKYTNEVGVKLVERLYESLVVTFGRRNIAKEVEVAGASNRIYHFDFQVGLESARILFDHVNPHPSSINAKAAAHMDVGRREDDPAHYLVYDKAAKWNAADVGFLQSLAQMIPVGKVDDVFQHRIRH